MCGQLQQDPFTLNDLKQLEYALDQHAIVSMADVTGKIIFANAKFCEISQYEQHELLGKQHSILNSGYHDAQFFRDMWQTIASGKVWQGEIRNRRKDGGFYWVQSTIVPYLDEAGAVSKYISIRTDITHVKAIEEQQRLLIQAIEASPSSFVLVDAAQWEHPIVYVNPAFERMTGYGAAEIAGKNCHFLQGNDTVQTGLDTLRDALFNGTPAHIRLRNYRKDGNLFWNEVFLTPLRNARGQLTHFVCILNDVTEAEKFEEELVNAKVAAELASQAKSEFLSRMSHELRTPLNAILGFGQLMESDPDETLSSDQKKNLALILDAGWHLLELINDLLDLSRIEAGSVDIKMTQVDVTDLIGECVKLTAPEAQRHGLALSLAGGQPMHKLVHADRTRLKQVLLNLLSNATKYNREGGSVSVAIQDTAAGRLRVSIADTGMGLSPAEIGQLFQPFKRLGDKNSLIEGTGIGLMISKRLIELMEGAIGVASVPGQGSTFWIDLVPGMESVAPRQESTGAKAPAPRSGSHSTILYVEDNPANLKLVEMLLARYSGVHFITAASGETGLISARENHPDLIIVDINLPGFDGFELLRRLKSNVETKATPIIALSANAMPQDIKRGLDAGFDTYIAKPIDVPAFSQAIEQFLPACGKPGL
jgi:hypothetical protein